MIRSVPRLRSRNLCDSIFGQVKFISSRSLLVSSMASEILRTRRPVGMYQCLTFSGQRFYSVSSAKKQADCSVQVTSFNFNEVAQWKGGLVVLILYAKSSPEAKHYVSNMVEEASLFNQSSTGQRVKVALIDCEREVELARRFQVELTGIPSTYFLYKGRICERFAGIMHTQQITGTLTLLMKSLASDVAEPTKSEDKSSLDSVLNTSKEALKEGKVKEAIALAKQVLDSVEPRLETFKSSIGFGQRKMTPEMLNKLKENEDAQRTLKCLVILAQCALHPDSAKMSDASELVARLKTEFPWCVKESSEVGEVIARVEMLDIVSLQDSDTVETLSKPVDDSQKEYERCLKLAYCYFLSGKMNESIETLLHVIAREAKLQIKKHGDANRSTPARHMIVLLFDAAGNDTPIVKEARKKLSAYLFC